MRVSSRTAWIGIATIVAVTTSFVSIADAEERAETITTALSSTTISGYVDVTLVIGDNSFARQFSPDIEAVPEPLPITLGVIGVAAVTAAGFRRQQSRK